jgi:hypothetical protein
MMKKKYWLKNVFFIFFIEISQYCASKCLVWIRPIKRTNFNPTFGPKWQVYNINFHGHNEHIYEVRKCSFKYNQVRLYFCFNVQVSLAIRGGYVPDQFQNANTKTGSLGPKLG